MGLAARVLPADPAFRAEEGPLSLAERVALVRPPCFWPALPGKKPLSPVERTGLVRLVDSIPGECADETAIALMEAMRHAPVGDVVEVGAGAGRTSALLVWLTIRYGIGNVLCLDDWSEADLAEFEVAVAPLADGRLNHRRGKAFASYGPGVTVASKTFGETSYEGRIAFLYLADGADGAGWTDWVAPGGWVVFGRAQSPNPEAFIAARRDRICARFPADQALFVQLKR